MQNTNPGGNMTGCPRPDMGRLGNVRPAPCGTGAVPAVVGPPGGPTVAKTGDAARGPLPAKTFKTTGPA